MLQEQQQTKCLKCEQNIISYILRQNNFKYILYLCKECWSKQQQQSMYITLQEYKQLLEDQLKQQESYALIEKYLKRLDNVSENIKKAYDAVKLLRNKLCEYFSTYQKLQQLIESAKTQIDRSAITFKSITEIQNLLTNFNVIEDDQLKWTKEIEMHEKQFYNYQFFTPNFHYEIPIEQVKSNINKVIKNPDFQKIIEQRILKDKADHPICFNTLPIDKGIVNDDNIYFGQKYQGKRQGLGLLIEQQNKIKFGYFINDKFTWGQIFIQENNKFNHLCGFFDNDLIQGEGYWELIINNKVQRYQGNFLNGLKNGQGHFEDELIYYKGQWENDEFHGQGEYYDGNEKYEGKFERGVKQGEFLVTDQLGSQTYKAYNKGKELIKIKKS